ncbi:hypothetical protein Tsp_02847 [Trichinella spiralis]|uniref:hypothetical protein n=1 Tax=Trichinella spiralis TaxID=6334 RepID=UPI0001EFC97C|nr:hypothetical protein Tsp_02847 [Trichinella spiralis]
MHDEENSHDMNTAYTCDRYQQIQFLINVLLQQRFMKTSKESRSPFPHDVNHKSREHRKHLVSKYSTCLTILDWGTKATCMEHTNPRIAASLFTPSLNYFPTHMILQQSEETVDRVSLYLTLLAFSAPTGENAPSANI